MKALLARLLKRVAPLQEAEPSAFDRGLPCPSCLDGWGRLHHCEAPASCVCNNPAVHF